MSVKGLRTKHAFFSACLSSMLICHVTTIHAEDLWNMSLEELQSVRVTSIATGTETPLDKAASVVSVITAEDIAEMGARDIEAVLETVPGMHVGRNAITYTPKFNMRGITSTYTPQTLILINGIPISSLYLGTPSLVWGGMPVKGIEKIEVIRGPGSALYGADAFAGVINITTKSATDIKDNQVGVSLGSFNTRNTWVNYRNRDSALKLGLTLEYTITEGFDSVITDDAQTLLDSLTGTSASLAAGSVNVGKEMLDARLEVDGENWTYRLGYQGRQDLEAGAGVSSALSPSSRFSSDRVNTDVTYQVNDLLPHWDLTGRMSYYYADQQVEEDNVLFPAGTNTIYPLGVNPLFPDGAIGNPEYREEQARFNIDSSYDGLDNHIFRFGLGYFWGDIYEVTEQKNFLADLTPRPGGLEDVSDTSEVYLPEEDRTSGSIYFQDEWLFAEHWALTSGLRYDHFSTFGESTNPRLALVWATTDTLTTKLLYGKAFRAPTIAELFVTSNPVTLGNPELEAEEIDSYELAFSHQITRDLHYAANFFLFDIEDYINFTPQGGPFFRAENTGSLKGKGFELEASYQVAKSLKVSGNFSYHKTEDKEVSDDLGETPSKQFFVRSVWDLTDSLQFNSQLNWVGKQDRAPSDDRAKVDDYTTVDLTLRAAQESGRVEFSISAKNIFDEDVFEASPPPSPPFTESYIPNDFPMAGRSFYAELSYKL